MKTHEPTKNTSKINLIVWIYLLAFVLMTWSFKSHAKKAEVKSDKNPVVVIDTSVGIIKVKLNSEKAPISVENFMKYVDKKFYDQTIFHRVIKDFMIQGGGHLADLKEKEALFPEIINEAKNGLSNKRGTIAMARTDKKDSATAQFFINVVDNVRLDHVSEERYGYAVFGEVIEGMAVVDKIKDTNVVTKTTPTGDEFENVPATTITINSIRKGK